MFLFMNVLMYPCILFIYSCHSCFGVPTGGAVLALPCINGRGVASVCNRPAVCEQLCVVVPK